MFNYQIQQYLYLQVCFIYIYIFATNLQNQIFITFNNVRVNKVMDDQLVTKIKVLIMSRYRYRYSVTTTQRRTPLPTVTERSLLLPNLTVTSVTLIFFLL